MPKSRKTTLEGRLEIVKYCLEQNKSYKEAAEAFQVPTVKYTSGGISI